MATISNDQREKLGTAFNNLIDMLRLEFRNVMFREHGNIWDEECRRSLNDTQQFIWDQSIKDGISPEGCIDLGNIGSIAIKNKPALKKKVGRQVNNLITWFNELREVRNDWAHNNPIDVDSWRNAIETMLKVAKAFKSEGIEADLRHLQGPTPDPGNTDNPVPPKEEALYTGDLKPWFKVVTPHEDIRMGSLDESVFAANLNQVHLGQGREVYSNAELFFEKTFFTAGLSSLAEKVVKSLNGENAGENRVLSLHTGFGGGKTHALISLYHIVQLGSKCNELDGLKALIEKTGKVLFDKANVAVFTNATNDPIQGREVEPGLRVQTIWGEIAYQLGGKAAYEKVRANDEARTGPKGIMAELLKNSGPTLILIDELADYCVTASAVTVGDSTLSDQTVSFIQELTEAVEKAPKAVLVATLPASLVEVSNSEKGAAILTSLQQRFIRVGHDTKPVEGDEIYEVIRRRLFESIGTDEDRKKALDRYMAYYEELAFNREIPDLATKQAYRKQMEKSFPFHPELIEVFRTRWASNHYFQRTRGVLRMLGSVTADLWKRRDLLSGNQAMIHACDLRLMKLPAITNQIRMLNGEGYQAVIDSDVSGKASAAHRIDMDVKELGEYDIAKGVAAVTMISSFGSDGANQGVSIQDLKLAMVRPDTFNHSLLNNVLDRMEERAHYLHFSTAGADKRYWFHTKPNLNILITEAKGEVSSEDIRSDLLERLKKVESRVASFNRVMVGVEDASVVPECKERTLVILGPSHVGSMTEPSKKTKSFIQEMATKRGEKNRIYRNTLLFLSANEQGYAALGVKVSESIACSRLLAETTNLEQDQRNDLERRRRQAEEGIDAGLASTFNLISKHSAEHGVQTLAVTDIRPTLPLQLNSSLPSLLKEEEWLISGVGYTLLERNNLLPTEGNPISVKAIAEAFIQFDDKPQVDSEASILSSLMGFCLKSRVAIAKGSSEKWEKTYLGETVDELVVSDTDVWYITVPEDHNPPDDPPGDDPPMPPEPEKDPPSTDSVSAITINGDVTPQQYTQLFQSFLLPMTHKQLNPQITVRIEAKIGGGAELGKNDPSVKAMTEAARQLGIDIVIR